MSDPCNLRNLCLSDTHTHTLPDLIEWSHCAEAIAGDFSSSEHDLFRSQSNGNIFPNISIMEQLLYIITASSIHLKQTTMATF